MHPLHEHPLVKQYIESNHFGKLLGMEFHIIEPGLLKYHIHIEEKHLATPHAAHGGVMAALADGAQGVCALSAVCSEQCVVSTLQMNIQFLAGPSLGDAVMARARLMKKGKRIAFTSCEIVLKESEKLLALASATFNIYPAQKAGYRIS